MDFQRFDEIASSEVSLNNKTFKMSDIDVTLASSISNDGSTSAQNIAFTIPPHANPYDSNDASQFNDNQLDLLKSLDYDNGADINDKVIVPEATANATIATSLQINENSTTSTGSTTQNQHLDDFGGDVDDYNDDTVSDISDLSDVLKLNTDILSDEMQRSIDWVHVQIASGVNPREYLTRIFANNPRQTIPENISDIDLWRVIAAILSDPPQRQRLQHIQTLENVCETIRNSKNIIVLTGAGVSVSCGIPDFRSRDGIYQRLRVDFPTMPDPQSMFDIGYFARDPRPFYEFAKEIYPGQFQPSLSHQFIKLLERKGKLLRNYTQNIDTLERVAGIENVIECHGSFATASCTRCKYSVDAEAIQDEILNQQIPICKICEAQSTKDYEDIVHAGFERPLNYTQLVAAGVMKPDIVFFGESLPDKFHSTIELDKSACDLLIVIGSSLKVRPVALIPSSINPTIPQILINREQLDHFVFDVELLGDSDGIINHLCHALGDEWNDICSEPPLTETNKLNIDTNNLTNIPPLLANAVIKKLRESNDSEPSTSSSVKSFDATTEPSSLTSSQDLQSDTCDTSDVPEQPVTSDASPTTNNFLPERTYFYNNENCYIFPGIEFGWSKDSDLESTSSDSSNENDEEEDDDMDMEMSTIDKNDIIGDGDLESILDTDILLNQTREDELNKYLLKRHTDNMDESEFTGMSAKRHRTETIPLPTSNESSLCTKSYADTS